MRRVNSILALTAITVLLNGCATQTVTPTTHDTYPAKNPQTVSLYSHEKKPNSAYRVIGVLKISKYNMLGMQRQEASVNAMMKKLAASIGGDGLIDVSQSDKIIQANVIAYQKILI